MSISRSFQAAVSILRNSWPSFSQVRRVYHMLSFSVFRELQQYAKPDQIWDIYQQHYSNDIAVSPENFLTLLKYYADLKNYDYLLRQKLQALRDDDISICPKVMRAMRDTTNDDELSVEIRKFLKSYLKRIVSDSETAIIQFELLCRIKSANITIENVKIWTAHPYPQSMVSAIITLQDAGINAHDYLEILKNCECAYTFAREVVKLHMRGSLSPRHVEIMVSLERFDDVAAAFILLEENEIAEEKYWSCLVGKNNALPVAATLIALKKHGFLDDHHLALLRKKKSCTKYIPLCMDYLSEYYLLCTQATEEILAFNDYFMLYKTLKKLISHNIAHTTINKMFKTDSWMKLLQALAGLGYSRLLKSEFADICLSFPFKASFLPSAKFYSTPYKNIENISLISAAAKHRHPGFVKYLLALGVRDTQNANGKYAMDYACEGNTQGAVAVRDALIGKQLEDINKLNEKLTQAERVDHLTALPNVALFRISQFCDPRLFSLANKKTYAIFKMNKNSVSRAALYCAVQGGLKVNIDMLLAAGANIDAAVLGLAVKNNLSDYIPLFVGTLLKPYQVILMRLRDEPLISKLSAMLHEAVYALGQLPCLHEMNDFVTYLKEDRCFEDALELPVFASLQPFFRETRENAFSLRCIGF